VHARALWSSAPTYDYCLRIGISSTEGLRCRFEDDDVATAALRRWSPTYRRATWAKALEEQGVPDCALADALAERFAAERRARHRVFTDVGPALSELRKHYALGLVTNGASCLQRALCGPSGRLGQPTRTPTSSRPDGFGRSLDTRRGGRPAQRTIIASRTTPCSVIRSTKRLGAPAPARGRL
jgi:hypothetical protein